MGLMNQHSHNWGVPLKPIKNNKRKTHQLTRPSRLPNQLSPQMLHACDFHSLKKYAQRGNDDLQQWSILYEINMYNMYNIYIYIYIYHMCIYTCIYMIYDLYIYISYIPYNIHVSRAPLLSPSILRDAISQTDSGKT